MARTIIIRFKNVTHFETITGDKNIIRIHFTSGDKTEINVDTLEILLQTEKELLNYIEEGHKYIRIITDY